MRDSLLRSTVSAFVNDPFTSDKLFIYRLGSAFGFPLYTEKVVAVYGLAEYLRCIPMQMSIFAQDQTENSTI